MTYLGHMTLDRVKEYQASFHRGPGCDKLLHRRAHRSIASIKPLFIEVQVVTQPTSTSGASAESIKPLFIEVQVVTVRCPRSSAPRYPGIKPLFIEVQVVTPLKVDAATGRISIKPLFIEVQVVTALCYTDAAPHRARSRRPIRPRDPHPRATNARSCPFSSHLRPTEPAMRRPPGRPPHPYKAKVVVIHPYGSPYTYQYTPSRQIVTRHPGVSRVPGQSTARPPL